MSVNFYYLKQDQHQLHVHR